MNTEGMQRFTVSGLQECFVALQPSRGRVGMPPQKPWLSSMELCCRRLGLNESNFSKVTKISVW